MKKLRIAFIGTGGIAAKHSKFMKNCPEVEIAGGCDVNRDVVESLWHRTWDGEGNAQHPPSFTDIDQMYDEITPDAVVVCTPHTMHFDHCMQALKRGCHVLVEKPMVTNADHAYQLRDKVNEAGKVFVIGFNTPCSAEFAFIRHTIRSQSLGDLHQVCGILTQPWMRAIKREGSWRSDPALSGGGQAYDSGAHLLNSLCWSVDSRVAKVHAFIDFFDLPVDINSNINVLFENGVMASILINGTSRALCGNMSFVFSKGRIDVDGWGAQWMNVYDADGQVKYPAVTEDMDAGEPAQNFIDAIHARVEPRTCVENGIVMSELMDAIYEAGRTGETVMPKRTNS